MLKAWFDLPASRSHPELVGELLDRYSSGLYRETGVSSGGGDRQLQQILEMPGWSDQPQLIGLLLARKMHSQALRVLAQPEWSDHPELAVEAIREAPDSWTTNYQVRALAKSGIFWEHPEVLRAMMARGGVRFPMAVRSMLTEEPWKDHPKPLLALVELLDQGGSLHPADDWVDQILRQGGWGDAPGLRELCGGRDPQAACLREALRREERGASVAIAQELSELSLPQEEVSTECARARMEEELRVEAYRRLIP
jgi:hypothetical protein